jgi:hypothetical protein
MDNPYWHAEDKTHVVDFDEVRQIVVASFNTVRASLSMMGRGVEPDEDEDREPSPAEKLHYELAETQLSQNLLRLAVLIRTLDDICSFDKDEAYSKKVTELNADNDIGTVTTGDKTDNLTLREAFNKIIHAGDVRPVYETDDDRDDPYARWGMDGRLELKGTFRGTDWDATVNIFELLDAVAELVDLVEEEND